VQDFARGQARPQPAMEHMDSDTLALARIVWDYLQLRHRPIPADIVVALGTNDIRVAEFAADLCLAGHGSILVCTGGVAHQGDVLSTGWDRPEAQVFAEAAARRGLPRDSILQETRSRNTAENIRFTRELVEGHGLRPRNILLAVKPFIERRAWAAMAVEWPEMPATVTSPTLSLEDYFTPELPPGKVIDIMLGDLQRLWVYARNGWSAPQRVPEEVRRAWRQLVDRGFTARLLPEE
jgi:uncharacterized SAM-binding protein YcdF (DUF218 family)